MQNGHHTLRVSNLHRVAAQPPSDNDSLSTVSYDDSNARRNKRRPRRSSAQPTRRAFGTSILMNGMFQKLLLLLIAVVLFDIVFFWDAFGDEIDSQGPEAGIHKLHDKNRIDSALQSISSKLHAINEAKVNTNNNDVGLLSDKDKILELEHEVEIWKGRYEMAVSSLHDPDMLPLQNSINDEDAQVMANELSVADLQEEKKHRARNVERYGVDDHIVKILTAANVEIDEELAEQLPTWDDIVSMYGDKPIIHGLDTCQTYRDTVKPEARMLGPAGMFNTGTNLLFELMKVNCNIKEARNVPSVDPLLPIKYREPRRNGMRWQAPWGKHNPPTTHRGRNVAKAWGKGITQTDFFPVVLIKDPYSWMGSQCRHKYTAFWGHDENHCPNLIRWRVRDKDETAFVRVKYALEWAQYESLLDMWNKWYEEWDEQTFPHLTTRFEDLLFHGEEVTRAACDCVGGEFTDNFKYVEGSAKPQLTVHKGSNGLVKAMLQYGDPSKRLTGFSDRDRTYASKNMDMELMNKYAYVPPILPAS
ncbi:hypothetical protein QTG54_002248 [Skeletonema marinoi]|uniref:Sulfotransferase domain-containing protein n=1 Tax=Skeletonema marinoi TaxID=267567 RepID=A0AAD8YI03_9STRA|nr:hypothetical protein QTG54_002248 [Skeletonema marinoi]